ncbi:aminoglycoside phosphotransferase family protein [Roseivivax sp. CAU 1753]
MTPEAFLRDAGWQDAAPYPIAGDASARAYTRLVRCDGETRILMADPEGDVSVFARLARYLTGLGLSAPRIFAEAPGLLLIEDLGDGLFARLAQDDPAQEPTLYRAAMDALVVLHAAAPPPDLVAADPSRLAQMTDLAFTQYQQRATGQMDRTQTAGIITALAEALDRHASETHVTILRDYHAENLLWLPDRDGPRRTGLLDFQDAMAGHPAYDVVSLLEDARRDVGAQTRAAAIWHYLDRTGGDAARFEAALAVQGAARNLRILGIFARLAATRGKPHYVDLIPRVWDHLMRDLANPALSAVAPRVITCLPAPTPALLERLKVPCQTP